MIKHEPHERRRVLVALSGGVDSACAAWLLRRAGHQVLGAHLSLRPGAEPDARAAASVARDLTIPFQVVDAQELFRDRVLLPFAQAYLAGQTPNPCFVCNPRVKWEALLRSARELGADAVATGHYARLARDGGRTRLLRAAAGAKDQSYFLARLSAAQLDQTLLPLGEMSKAEVRAAMQREGVAVADRPESQDTCFAGRDGHAQLVEALAGRPEPGEIVDLGGRVLGRHQGVHLFTVGQRRGLKVSADQPLYVVAIDAASRRVTVGPRDACFADRMEVRDLRWLRAPDGPLQVKVRYRSPAVPCRVEPEGDHAWVSFSRPQRAVTPGQAAVFYRSDEVVGGAIIARAERN